MDEIVGRGPTLKVWVTKYALSTGVYRAAGKCAPEGWFVVDPGGRRPYLLSKGQWQESADAARCRVADMIAHELESHRRAVEKLEQIRVKLARGELPVDTVLDVIG